MKKQLLVAVLATLLTQVAVASEDQHMVYGWDIQCRGHEGLKLRAYQSDDDFYIEYRSSRLAKTKVWAGSEDQYSLRLKTLLFVTDQKVSKGPDVSLSVIREELNGPGYATGVIHIEGDRYDLNCYVRFGKDEDDFFEVFKKPFPAIREPRN